VERVRAAVRVFGYPRFSVVWSGETLSMLGDFSYQVVFVWLVLHVTGSVRTLTAVLVVQAVPFAILLLLGGAVADRLSPRTVMLAAHLARALIMAGITVAAALGVVRTWELFGLAAAFGVADAFFWPASDSILPSLLPAALLERGNAAVGFGEQGARLLGPLLGALLVHSAGLPAALGFNAATYLLAALTVTAAPAQPPAPGRGPGRAIGADIAEGLRYARRSREFRIVFLLLAAATLSYSGLFSVGLPALSRTFPDGPLALGLLLSAWGLGQLLGSVSAMVTGLPRRWGLLIIGMTLCEGTAFALLGLLPRLWVAVAVLALLGFGVAYSTDVALPTFIQTRTPPQVLGRVNSVLNLPRTALSPLSIALMGLLAAWNLRWCFVAAALPMLGAGLRVAFSADARHLSTGDPAANPRSPGSLARDGPGAVRGEPDGRVVAVVPLLRVAHRLHPGQVLLQHPRDRGRRGRVLDHLGAPGEHHDVAARRRAVEVQRDVVVGGNVLELRAVRQ
jgi:MFS family permease